MNEQNPFPEIHPMGERSLVSTTGTENTLLAETFSGRIHVGWDPDSPVTPMGQLAFFIDFLKTAELFAPWVDESPLSYASNNAPKPGDVLGTLLLSVLAGHHRYAHMAALRCDGVNPALLGMNRNAVYGNGSISGDVMKCYWTIRGF